jgi:hypothetical protein
MFIKPPQIPTNPHPTPTQLLPNSSKTITNYHKLSSQTLITNSHHGVLTKASDVILEPLYSSPPGDFICDEHKRAGLMRASFGGRAAPYICSLQFEN